MACATSTTQTDDHPPLLNLPPELRNTIYRLALVHSDNIVIDADSTPPPEPDLLVACRQIRYEAQSIYYKENVFSFKVRDADATMLLRFKRRHRHRKVSVRCMHIGGPNWINLKTWLESSFQTGFGLVPRGPDNPLTGKHKDYPIRMCFEVMHKLKKEGLSWEKVERVLEDLHTGMMAVDPAWK